MFRARRLFSVVFVVISIASSAALADIQWLFRNEEGQRYFEGRPSDEESDTVLWALCKSNGKAQVGLGGDYQLGKGNGERVSAVLRSAGKEARLDGLSRKSRDSEMTGGTELQKMVSTNDKLFAVLATGKDVQVKASSFDKVWSAHGLAAAAKKFLKACK